MIFLRECIATAFYCSALYAFFQVFFDENPFKLAVIAIALLLVSYWVWPSKKRGQRSEDSWFMEVLLEFLIELPIDVAKIIFKFLFRGSGKGDGGIDIDI